MYLKLSPERYLNVETAFMILFLSILLLIINFNKFLLYDWGNKSILLTLWVNLFNFTSNQICHIKVMTSKKVMCKICTKYEPLMFLLFNVMNPTCRWGKWTDATVWHSSFSIWFSILVREINLSLLLHITNLK